MRQVRVLVAEDNEDHRFLTLRALRDVEGVTIHAEGVGDGAEALDYVYRRGAYADRELPDVIFLDLRMPKINGLEVLERVKSDPALAPIPVVVLTSSTRPEDVDRAYALGTNSYVAKPGAGTTYGRGLRGVADYWTTEVELPPRRATSLTEGGGEAPEPAG